MKKVKVYLVMIIAAIFVVAGSGLAAVVSPLDGVSDESTFEGWVGDGTGPVPAGWSYVAGYTTIRTFRPYGYPWKNAGLGITWPPSRDFTYFAQYTYTSVAVQANTLYELSFLAGSFEWETGQADYSVRFGTVSGGVFTPFATSDVKRVTFAAASTYIGDSTGINLSFTGISGSAAPSGVLAVQIQVMNINNWWAAMDNVRLETEDLTGPIITTQPISQNIELNETAVFTVAGLNIVSYQWYKGATALTNGGKISGATTNTLTISNVQIADEAKYFCRVSGTSSSVDSDKATLLITKLLVAYWSFDGNLNDSSGLGNDGTAVGSISYATGVDNMPNSALYLENIEGTQNYVRISDPVYSLSIPDADLITYTGPLTLSLWVKPSFIQSYEMYVSTGYPNNGWYMSRHGASAQGRFFINSASGVIETSGLLNDGDWHMITAVVDVNANKASLYLDGVKQDEGPAAHGPGMDFLVGALMYPDQSIACGYTGLLDDIRVYCYALSDEEITQLFHAVTDNAVCVEVVTGDINEDCWVDIVDFAIIAEHWLNESVCPEPIGGDINGDCRVNFCDFTIISDNWLNCTLIPGVACEE